MRFAVLGTGMVGQAVAEGLARLGHEVSVGTRDVAATMARSESPGPSFLDWLSAHPEVMLATFDEAARRSEVLVNATTGSVSVEALEAAGRENLAGKVLIDIANPLEFSPGKVPTLFVSDADSLGERIQRAFPEVRVVKALNTITASLMMEPHRLNDGDFTTFVSGDDPDAKSTVIDLMVDLGHKDVIDLGDITTARGTEMLMAIWLRLFAVLGTPVFSMKVVR